MAMLSRVADSLYWTSRYIERAEHTARLLDVHLNLLLESGGDAQTARWNRLIEALEQEVNDPNTDDYRFMYLMSFDNANPQSIMSSIGLARENSRQIREQISSEMWNALNGFYLNMKKQDMDIVWNAQPHEFFRMVREGSHMFQGITDSTMVRSEGWHFIQLGRFIERAISIISLVDVQMKLVAVKKLDRLSMSEYFDWMSFLKCVTAFEAYCKVYSADLQPDRIVNFVLFDASFPHSLRFCIECVVDDLDRIATLTNTPKGGKLNRLLGRIASQLSYDEVSDVQAGSHTYFMDLRRQCQQIHDAIYETYISRPIG
jgi:uncharacterized alpha-E superfamily protein